MGTGQAGTHWKHNSITVLCVVYTIHFFVHQISFPTPWGVSFQHHSFVLFASPSLEKSAIWFWTHIRNIVWAEQLIEVTLWIPKTIIRFQSKQYLLKINARISNNFLKLTDMFENQQHLQKASNRKSSSPQIIIRWKFVQSSGIITRWKLV